MADDHGELLNSQNLHAIPQCHPCAIIMAACRTVSTCILSDVITAAKPIAFDRPPEILFKLIMVRKGGRGGGGWVEGFPTTGIVTQQSMPACL